MASAGPDVTKPAGEDIYGGQDMLLAVDYGAPAQGYEAGVGGDPETGRTTADLPQAVPGTPPAPVLNLRTAEAGQQTPKKVTDAGTQCFPGLMHPSSVRKPEVERMLYGEPPKKSRTGLWVTLIAIVCIAIGLGVGLGVGLKQNPAPTDPRSASAFTLAMNNLPPTTASKAVDTVVNNGVLLRTDVAKSAGLANANGVYITEVRETAQNTILSSFGRSHPINAATGARRLGAAAAAASRALAELMVTGLYIGFEVEAPNSTVSAIQQALSKPETVLGTAFLNAIASSLGVAADTIKVATQGGLIVGLPSATPSSGPRPTETSTATRTSTATMSQTSTKTAVGTVAATRSAAPTYSGTPSTAATYSPTATATTEYFRKRPMLDSNSILVSRVDANRTGFSRVEIDELAISNVPGYNVFAAPDATRRQTLYINYDMKDGEEGGGVRDCYANHTMPCLTLPSTDRRVGHLTLSQDRCYVTLAGVNVPETPIGVGRRWESPLDEDTDETYWGRLFTTKWPNNDIAEGTKPNGQDLSFVLLTKSCTSSPACPNPQWRSFYQYAGYDSKVTSTGQPIPDGSPKRPQAKAREDVPRGVGYGMARFDKSDSPDGRTLFYVTGNSGVNGKGRYLRSITYDNTKAHPYYTLDKSITYPGSGLCFGTDQSNPPAFYQHLLTVTQLTYGAIRAWADQPTLGNTPCTGSKYAEPDVNGVIQPSVGGCAESSTIYGYYGASNNNPSELRNCAAYLKTEKIGSDMNFFFWSEYGARAAVKRGVHANGQWITQEFLWTEKTNSPTSWDNRVVSIAFSSEMYMLFAVTPDKLFIAANPLDLAVLVRWYTPKVPGYSLESNGPYLPTLRTSLLPGSQWKYRGVAIVPRNCDEPQPPTVSPVPSTSSSATVTSSASPIRTRSVSSTASVTTSVSVTVSVTVTSSAEASTVPQPYEYGNVVVSRLRRVPMADTSKYHTLARVYVDEYVWGLKDVPTEGVTLANATAQPQKADKKQEMHFPHRPKNDRGDALSEPWRLTLPWDKEDPFDLGLGQITTAQDQCAFVMAGLNVPLVDVGNSALFDATTGNPISGYATGYPITVARVGGRGWQDRPWTWYKEVTDVQPFKHWLPSKYVWLNGGAGGTDNTTQGASNNANAPNLVDLYATNIFQLPKAATITSSELTNSKHSFQVYVVNNEIGVTGDLTKGSIRGRCWWGKDTTGKYGGAANEYCKGNTKWGSPITSPPAVQTNADNNDYPDAWTIVDPYNTDGTQGICWVGSPTSTDLRMLQVRKLRKGALQSWPEATSSTDPDKSYTPSLSLWYYDMRRNPNPSPPIYGLSPISKTITTGGVQVVDQYAGYVSPTGDSKKLRNCAGRTTSYAGVEFEVGSFMFWSERGAGVMSVQRTDWDSQGYWQENMGIWMGPGAPNSLTAPINGWYDTTTNLSPGAPGYYAGTPDYNVIGVALYNEPNNPAVYAVTFKGLYGTMNPFAKIRSPNTEKVYWTRLAYVKDDLEEFRGVAIAPRRCAYVGFQFRALAEGEEEALAAEGKEVVAA